MKKLLLLLFIFIQVAARAQVKIGLNPTTINPGSLLELETTNKGFVPPRVALTSLTVTTPLPAGLITGTVVFNTATGIGSGIGLYYWNGAAWVAVTPATVASSSWALAGNSGINPASNFVGTTDAQPLIFKANNTERMRILSAGNIGIGTTTPPNALSIIATNPLYLSGLAALSLLTGTDSILIISSGIVKKAPPTLFAGGGGGGWLITGNNNTTSSANFIGTTNDQGITFRTNNTKAGFVGSTNDGLGRTSFGGSANAGDQNATAIGFGANASANSSSAFGFSSSASGQNALSMGVNATASQSSALAVGFGASASAQQSIAIGTSASASSSVDNIAIGTGATASVQNGIAIGPNATVTTSLTAMALGHSARASGQTSTAIGDQANASAQGSLAIGVNTTASGTGSIAMGNGSVATSVNTTAYGTNAQATAAGANVFGNASTASGTNSLVVGNGANATAASSITVGDNSIASDQFAIAIGNSAKAQAQGSIALGVTANVGTGATNSLVIGSGSSATASNVIIIGNGITGANQANALVLGPPTTVNVGIGTATPNTSTKLDVNGPVKLGTAGTVLNGIIRTTVTIDPTSIAIGATVAMTVAVTGVNANATIIINPRSNLTGGAIIAWARATAGNIIVGFSGSGVVVDPPSITYDVTIIQ